MTDQEDWLQKIARKEQEGVLTFLEAPINTYLKLTTGPHAGRVVIKPHKYARIDDRPITWFVLSLTWVYVSDINDARCERVPWGYRE